MIRRLCGIVTLKPESGRSRRELEEVAKLIGGYQQRNVDRVDPFRLEGAVVNVGRDRLTDGVGNHAVDLCGFREFVDAVKRPQLPRVDLTGRGALNVRGRRISKDSAEPGRKNPRGKADLAHGERDQGNLRAQPAGGQNAAGIGGLARRADDLINVRRDFLHALEHGFQRRRGFEVMPGNDQLGAACATERSAPARPRRFRSRHRWRARRTGSRDRGHAAALRYCR